MNPYNEVLFTQIEGKGGDLGIITLNRPQVLNSLNHDMVQAMFNQLQQWRIAPEIKAVIICAAEGRAFCAGGDLRSTHERYSAHDATLSEFFRLEYSLNKAIFHFPKPYIALLDGITMGGGVGISIHGSHRVATERLLFAMPETGIGFFPDVGGTYFLPRLPGKIGYYLGLTGARLKIEDALRIGLVTQHVKSEKLNALIEALANTDYQGEAYRSVTAIINKFTDEVSASPLLAQQSILDKAFAGPSMETIMQNLEKSAEPICQNAHAELLKKSPTSLKITLRAFIDHANKDFDACMQQEFRLTCRFLQAHDFAEGIRAVIIDKDQKPHWQPPVLSEVSADRVEHYFAPLEKELA